MSETPVVTCDYYMIKFKRNCRDLPIKNSTRCEFHLDKPIEKRERVPCPYGCNTLIWSDNLKKHLTKCNKFLEKQFGELSPCYKKNVNVKSDENNYKNINETLPEAEFKDLNKPVGPHDWVALLLDKFLEVSEQYLKVENIFLERAKVDFDKNTEKGRHKFQLVQIL